MSTNQDDYLMPLADEMKLKAYSTYVRRQGLDPLEYHHEAVQYLEGDAETPPLAWSQAMDVLKGGLEE